MNHIIKTLFILYLFIAAACNKRETGFGNLLTLPQPNGKFELQIDSLSSYKILYPQYFLKDSLEKLITLNYNLNRLDFYRLDGGKIEKTIYYDPNLDFWKISGYSYLNKDSIFLINEVNDLLLTDYEGVIKNKINVKSSSILGKPHIIPGYLDVVVSKSHIEIPNYFVAQKDVPSRIQVTPWEESSLRAGVVVESDFVDGYNGIFEYLYWTYQQVGDYFYVNWPNLSLVYKYDIDWNFIEKVELDPKGDKKNRLIFKSGLSAEELRQKPSIGEMQDISSNYTSNFVFVNFIHNPYQDEFYRIIGYPMRHGIFDIFQYGLENLERNYSVMVFDKELNFKNEYAIPEGEYLIKYGSYFATRNGLAIQRENKETEDLAVFDVFRFP